MTTTATTTTTVTTTTEEVITQNESPKQGKESAREGCSALRFLTLALSSLVTLIITCYYISQAVTHSKVINENSSILKAPPFTDLELSYQTIGYAFAIGRVIFIFLSMILLYRLPEYCVTGIVLLNLVFEIPMAIVAQSRFGERVLYSTLDPTPSYVSCAISVTTRGNTTTYSSYSQSQQMVAFYSSYAKLVDKQPQNICQEFVKEGNMLRVSLLVPWFIIGICFFLTALIGLCNTPAAEREWSDFLLFLTGFNFHFRRRNTRMPSASRRSRVRPSLGGLRRWKSSAGNTLASETSTMVDQEMQIVQVDVKDANKFDAEEKPKA